MIHRLFTQLVESMSSSETSAPDGERRESALRMATAVLMLDVARADHVFDESEFERILRLIEHHFALSSEDAAKLVNAASDKADEMVSLHDFTQLLNDRLSEKEKGHVVELLWQIAYADGRLDKYEDALVLKISDLLYVSRGFVMRLKHDAQLAAGAA